MVDRITIGKQLRGFAAGTEIEFRSGVNLLVGDQGCGKSTLLTALENAQLFFRGADINVEMRGNTVIRSHDFEKLNPRLSTALGGSVSPGLQMQTLFASHGQSTVMILAEVCKRDVAPGTTFLFDEPDTGLSVRSCKVVARFFRMLADQGHQVIAAVHNPMLFLAFEWVYSVEHKAWMKPGQFLETQVC
jgi:predicted ATPase